MRLARLAIVGLAAGGCGATARSADDYRNDTKRLFDTADADIKGCYNRVLATTPTASGLVTVTFAVEPDTGKISGVKVDPSKTTAPEVLDQCVLSAISNLALSPGDKHRGVATWSWSFTAPAPTG